jgi:hypothetical protein
MIKINSLLFILFLRSICHTQKTSKTNTASNKPKPTGMPSFIQIVMGEFTEWPIYPMMEYVI